jgi:hypothetical protein
MNSVTVVSPVSPAVEALGRETRVKVPTEPIARRLDGTRIGFRLDWPSFHVFADEVGTYLREEQGVGETPWWDLNVQEGNPELHGGRSYNRETADQLLGELAAQSDAIVVGLAN